MDVEEIGNLIKPDVCLNFVFHETDSVFEVYFVKCGDQMDPSNRISVFLCLRTVS